MCRRSARARISRDRCAGSTRRRSLSAEGATCDAARRCALLDVKDAVAGRIAIDATATGPLSSPAIDARVSGTALQFGSIGGVQLDANAAYDPGGSRRARCRRPACRRRGAAPRRAASSRSTGEPSRVDAAAQWRRRRDPDARLRAAVCRGDPRRWHAARRVAGTGIPEGRGRGARDADADDAARSARSRMPVGGRVTAARQRPVDRRPARSGVTAAGAQVNGSVAMDDRAAAARRAARATSPISTRTTARAEAFLGRPRGSLLPTPVAGADDRRRRGSAARSTRRRRRRRSALRRSLSATRRRRPGRRRARTRRTR